MPADSQSSSAIALPADTRAARYARRARTAGSVSSARKTATSQANGRQGGRPRLPLPCTCADPDAGHKARCPLGRALKRRKPLAEISEVS